MMCVDGCLHVVRRTPLMCLQSIKYDCEDVLSKDSLSDICTVSSTDYFTSISLRSGFYILFQTSSEKEAQ